MKKFYIFLLTVLFTVSVFPAITFAGENSNGAPTDSMTTEPADPLDLPSWYPENPSDFKPFHDKKAPRINDFADILSNEIEQEFEGYIRTVQENWQKDIVIVTDNSAYSLGMEKYAADFYGYNGFGTGNEYEGLCLFICMVQNHPEFYITGTGSDTIALLTETNRVILHNALYDNFAKEDFYTGIYRFIVRSVTMFDTGYANAPVWYPARGFEALRSEDTSAPAFFVDDDGIKYDPFTRITEEAVKNQILTLQKKTDDLATDDDDVSIYITENYCGTVDDFIGKYYLIGGRGAGDNYSGTIFLLCAGTGECFVKPFGNTAGQMNDTAISRMVKRATNFTEKNDLLGACEQFLSDYDLWKQTGRVPRPLSDWLIIAGIIIAAAVIVCTGILTFRAKSARKVPLSEAGDSQPASESDPEILNTADFRTDNTDSDKKL